MRQLTIERAAVIIVFALLFALATHIPLDTDVWWHLRSGEYTLTHGMIFTDPFSFTLAGADWVNHSWGAEIILYGIWQVLGNFGLAIYTAGLATAGMWFVYRTCSGNVYLRAFALVIGAAAAAAFWSPRPQMLSFFLSTVILYLLYLHKRRNIDRLWLIPLIVGIWGNLHAGFAIGFIVLIGSMAGEILGHLFNTKGEYEYVVPWAGIRKLALVTVVSIVAICINPYGLKMLAVPFQTISIGALQNFIQEWNSPNFHERQVWPFAFLILAILGAVGASKKRLDWTDFVLSAGTFFLGLFAGRNIALFAVIATPVLTHHLDDFLTERGWNLRPIQRVTLTQARLNAILVGLIVLGSLAKVVLVLNPKEIAEAQEAALPVKAIEYMKSARPPANLFNSYNWGGYLIFNLPDDRVFVDGRTDLYGDDFLSNVYIPTATGAPGWRETLDKYGINTVFMETASGLAWTLRTEPGWKVAYEDKLAVIFVRENPIG